MLKCALSASASGLLFVALRAKFLDPGLIQAETGVADYAALHLASSTSMPSQAVWVLMVQASLSSFGAVAVVGTRLMDR